MHDIPFTLIVPTYNRHELFIKLISYLSNEQAGFQIIVLDSSRSDIQKDNKIKCTNSGLNITFYGYQENTTPLEKWLDGLRKVTTEYVSLCADDDIIFPDAIYQNIDFLSKNRDYIACHGNYVNFSEDDMPNIFVEYSAPSIDGETILARMWQLMSNYEAISYATFRTDIIKNTFVDACKINPSPMFAELFLGNHHLISGKVKRLPILYYARKSEVASLVTQTRSHPLTYFTNYSEEFFSQYVVYRNSIMEVIEEYDQGYDRASLMRHVDLIHSVYFMYSCDINHIINLLNTELNITVPVFENMVVNSKSAVTFATRQNYVSKYDLICATKEVLKYNWISE